MDGLSSPIILDLNMVDKYGYKFSHREAVKIENELEFSISSNNVKVSHTSVLLLVLYC